jgi:hypothetical protein
MRLISQGDFCMILGSIYGVFFKCIVIGRLPLEEKSLTLAHKVLCIDNNYYII